MIIVLSLLVSVALFSLYLIYSLLFKIFLALNTLVVLSLPDDNDGKKFIIKQFDSVKTFPVTRFE